MNSCKKRVFCKDCAKDHRNRGYHSVPGSPGACQNLGVNQCHSRRGSIYLKKSITEYWLF